MLEIDTKYSTLNMSPVHFCIYDEQISTNYLDSLSFWELHESIDTTLICEH